MTALANDYFIKRSIEDANFKRLYFMVMATTIKVHQCSKKIPLSLVIEGISRINELIIYEEFKEAG